MKNISFKNYTIIKDLGEEAMAKATLNDEVFKSIRKSNR